MKRELGIARCGLACCLCSENEHCGGCRSGDCPDKDRCENRKCSIAKGLSYCFECDIDCRKGLLSKIKPLGFTLFAKKYGMEKLLDCLEKNEARGIVYHREGISGDYDDFDNTDDLIEFIRTGEKRGPEAYLFGQILGTHSFLLKDGFLQPDEYSEISAQYFLPGGETGTAATVLQSLGVSVRIDGTWIGTEVAPMLRSFYAGKKVDLSPLCFTEDDPGIMDYVVIAGLVRSPMGRFQTLFSSGRRWWNVPKEEDIAGCKAAAVDPFFGEESRKAAELCLRHDIPYVTIDSRHDSFLHRNAAVNIVSRECTSVHYPGMSAEDILRLMQNETDGLTIITQGGNDMLYGRKGQPVRRMRPFSVEVKSTLGAGDTYKAGCVYGLLHSMSDEELVRFAAACSAVAISRFPLPLNPPRPEEVNKLIENHE